MNKKEFFRYCETSTMPLRVTWGGIHRESERAVFLRGLWARGAIVDVQLYRPWPGRQWEHDCGRDAIAACEKSCIKFQRWLDEWKTANPEKVLSQEVCSADE